MYTNNYTFSSVNAIKIILNNSENKILLIQEPGNNNWMPLHWGLPGGKPTETESLLETFYRKVKSDIGQEVELKGLVKIQELLMKGRTVLMYIVLAVAKSGEVMGEGANYRWVSKDEIEKMKVSDFTEFYNKELILDYFNKKLTLIPISVLNTLEYYKYDNNKDYQDWLESGKVTK